MEETISSAQSPLGEDNVLLSVLLWQTFEDLSLTVSDLTPFRNFRFR